LKPKEEDTNEMLPLERRFEPSVLRAGGQKRVEVSRERV
jgi:hypothetical protein